jgi:hypothetical protein
VLRRVLPAPLGQPDYLKIRQSLVLLVIARDFAERV